MTGSEEFFTSSVPAVEPADIQPVTANQPTRTPTPKMTSVGIGGGFTGVAIAWLKARFDLEITAEDVALVLPIVTFAAGYFTKEFRGQ